MSANGSRKSGLLQNPGRPLFNGYSQMQQRSNRQRSEPRVYDGDVISDETAELLESTGSVTASKEFKQWLHIWTIDEHSQSLATQVMYPWVRLWDKPDLSLMSATYLMTDFVNFPTSWQTFWHDVEDQIKECRTKVVGGEVYKEHYGPYWRLLPVPSLARLAGEIAAMKRRIQREVFEQYPQCTPHDRLIREALRTTFLQALEPFRVLSPQQEKEDEIARVAEERSRSLRVRDRFAPGRPPRCR